jgi:release factor glutamine methyltransferase
MQSIAATLKREARRLAASGIDTPRLDAEVLLRSILEWDRATLLMRLREPLSPADQERISALVDQRLMGISVAYLIGNREFMGLPFAVGPGVLVPRPETELLVEWALAWLQSYPAKTVVDVGTGSGAIAISLAAHLDAGWDGWIIASDRSPEALRYAAANRVALDRAGRVQLVRGNLLDWYRGPVDLLLANLPYLRPDQIEGNLELKAEPSIALLGGRTGLDLIRQLLIDAPRVMAPGGAVGLETDPANARDAAKLAHLAFPDSRITIQRDLAGFERLVLADLQPVDATTPD